MNVPRRSDQIIEHMHSYIDKMLNKSKYKLKIVDSEQAAKYNMPVFQKLMLWQYN